MYLGGDIDSQTTNTYFYGKLKQLTIWKNPSVSNFPLDTTIDQRNIQSSIFFKNTEQ